MIGFKWMILVLPVFEMAGQTQPAVSIQVHPQMAGRSIRDGQVTTVYLVPRYATAIRMPEAINSVVVGDPGSFSAEHSDREPQLVFVKPITPKPAQTNLLISTTRGLQVSLLLVSRGEPKGDQEADIDRRCLKFFCEKSKQRNNYPEPDEVDEDRKKDDQQRPGKKFIVFGSCV